MLQFNYQKKTLIFCFKAATSRGTMQQRNTFFLLLRQKNKPALAIGEAAPLQGLSFDDLPNFENLLQDFCEKFSKSSFQEITPSVFEWIHEHTQKLPSVRFAAQTAALDWQNGCKKIILDNDFHKGKQEIPINGLIWMGSYEFMRTQIEKKIRAGFNCIKIKVGGIDFKQELQLIKGIRQKFSPEQITIRLDANGAFGLEQALQNLEALAPYNIHSIEQPIRKGQIENMQKICRLSPIPIALDEELIGIFDKNHKKSLLNDIKPHFIILKPSLIGGIADTLEWINLAQEQKIGWWLTSALESNIGLNAITQLCASLNNTIPQGLGTGQLYENNVDSPLKIEKGKISYDTQKNWAEL